MNFIDSFQNQNNTILIPLLQRDYVQGSKDSAVISPFLDALLGGECDLNYIYGYDKDGCFVPVDGQQRLITLWSLYLYLYARTHRSKEFRVKLKFESREYAQDFCERLNEHLESILTQEKEIKNLGEYIKDQSWFIRSWSNSPTVANMLGTLKLIHQKMSSRNTTEIWKSLVENPTVSFAFLRMDENNGLDDDIYIKMNGRGRKLSAFENLKSWMDEKVSGLKLTFSSDWKTNMDNSWTKMFWQNRNLEQDHPEEIDDEQLFFFYNLLILYHLKNGTLKQKIADIREKKFDFEELLTFIGTEGNITDEEIVKTILEKLQKASDIPLLWFDRLCLMPKDFFEFAYGSINNIVGLYVKFNDMGLYIGEEHKEHVTPVFQISMRECSFGRTLPLFYALLSYKSGKTRFKDWMRVMRNLILNTSIESKELPSILNAIENFSAQCSKDDIYSLLLKDGIKESLKAFGSDSEQVNEEILKAGKLNILEQMKKLENGRFFSGRINVLFKMLPPKQDPERDVLNKETVYDYVCVLLKVFDGSDGGVTPALDSKDFLFRRALMTFEPYRFGIWTSNCWSFCDGMAEWRRYVNTNDRYGNALYSLFQEVLVPAYKEGKDLRDALSAYVEKISCDLLVKDENAFRYHFIHHPGVWQYMETKRCKWISPYDIELKTSNGNNSNRMELRTYSLYLDYRHNDDYKSDYPGWRVDVWQKEQTCLFFERKVEIDGKKQTLALDVYFKDDQWKRTSEDCYSFDLFVRSNHPDETEYYEKDDRNNRSIFIPILKDTLFAPFDVKYKGRLHSNKSYSRGEVRKILCDILQGINSRMNRITPQYIESLKEGEVFVFGSNKEGMHGGGAAAKAFRDFGAEWGVGVGMTGRCYAIPTMDGSLDIIRRHVDGFTAYAKAHPDLTFLVTPIGCGIAGWRESEIAPLFREASKLPNVTLPEGFWTIIG
jgi:hypothetical protein